MSARTMKKIALIASAGVLLQVGSCGTVIAQIVANQVFTQVIRGIVDALLGSNTTTTTE